MNSYLIVVLTIALMFASGHCISTSMSCSTVNGKTICKEQTSSGNSAGAFSSSFSGSGNHFQEASVSGSGKSKSSRKDGHTPRRFGIPGFYPNNNAALMRGSNHLFGTGASKALSFRSGSDQMGTSSSGFRGTSNNFGIPGLSFGGFSVVNPNGNSFSGGGNTRGGGYAHGHGLPFNPFEAVSSMMGSSFPFSIFGRKR